MDEVEAGKGDVGENSDRLVIWRVANPISYEAIGEIDERMDLAQPFALLRTVLSTDTNGGLWRTPCASSQDLCLFPVKLLKLTYGPKRAAKEIGYARISRCPPKIVREVFCFFGQIQMVLMVLLPLPQIEIDSGLSALCTCRMKSASLIIDK